MKITELLLEISASAKRAQKIAKREAALAARAAEERALADKIAKRTQRKLAKFNQPIAATVPPAASAPATAPFGSPELEKYMVDPNVDPEFQGGYYLQFEKNGNNIVAYWSMNPDYTASQMQQVKQVANMNPKFNPDEIAKLIEMLKKKSGKGTEPGYVNIVIPKQYASDWALFDKTNYFRKLLEYLAREYPHNEYTADASVNWEIA